MTLNTVSLLFPYQVLGDLVESVMGAIFVSDRFEDQGVAAFFERVLRPFYDHHIRLHTLAEHPTKSLFELLQAEGCYHHAMRKSRVREGIQSEGE